MTEFTLDWNGIRPLNGSRAAGFEELCAQLAHAEVPRGVPFERKGTPDGGVECYATLDDGEWGWQAKYIDTLDKSQWAQIDKSVRTAITTHPTLVRYFVCAPLDRPDPRIPGRRSARDKWDDHVRRWQTLAGPHRNIAFVWWGSHEMLERLTRPDNAGRTRFWFDATILDHHWFGLRLDEVLKAAGPRYTPALHVNLPISQDLETFGREDGYLKRIKSQARPIRREARTLAYNNGAKLDSTIEPLMEDVQSRVEEVLSLIGHASLQPAGAVSFKNVTEAIVRAEEANDRTELLLRDREREFDTQDTADRQRHSYHHNPLRDLRFRLSRVSNELSILKDMLEQADRLAGTSLLVLRGVAGTGKTHLLCDLTQKRLEAGRPTVLLMGQQFRSQEDPWTQALRLLDLPSTTTDEFVGALEAAAEAAQARALIIVDALNEGSGRDIWPAHLGAFLARVDRSEWIGILLSVRTSYEETVIPSVTRERAAQLTHLGFQDVEYDATKAFFVYYGLEFPSTPLLAPEFRNPLFLKTLCEGLRSQGGRRIPRGVHGITAVFDMYLKAMNLRLAQLLDFNPKDNLVRQGLEAFARSIAPHIDRSMPRPQGQRLIDTLLPGRAFEQSLYRGLVTEGLLIEDIPWGADPGEGEVVLIAYDRFADHLIASSLLDGITQEGVEAAFSNDGPLSFLWTDEHQTPPGLVEALCIQVPERFGKELPLVAPQVMSHWQIGEAFRQSLIWRLPAAFSNRSREVLNDLIRTDMDLTSTFEAILTVATLPGHPLNARFLDTRLRRDTMPDRDAWWSVYLHATWQEKGAVDRLIDWAASVRRDDPLEEESVDLASTALSWVLTSSNRYLRDRATKAIVNLLSGRELATSRLVTRFADVDDPYVTERVFAAAYGVAMRSRDAERVGELARVVYAHVFAGNQPPPQILLRDYARGVIERALSLGSALDLDVAMIRPPYRSTWPPIPTEEEIKPLLPNWEHGSHDSGEVAWAHNRIGSSVMSDDFARYVIGTNSGATDWLSLRLGQPEWRSSATRRSELLATLTSEQGALWTTFVETEHRLQELHSLASLSQLRHTLAAEDGHASPTEPGTDDPKPSVALEQAQAISEKALAALNSALTSSQRDTLAAILAEQAKGSRPPRFDLRVIQRYVLWRVFDFGWTIARFGRFDRFSIGYHGREASKAERIGKKYQWIALHEIQALMADHFQYRESYREDDGDQAYEGPWQDFIRDIDPSCTVSATVGGTSWDGHVPSWWAPDVYEAWDTPADSDSWVREHSDLPKPEGLIAVRRSIDDTAWLNLHSFLKWREPSPPDQERGDQPWREVWYMLLGYLVRQGDAPRFMEWAEGVDFMGRWMPEPPTLHRMFLGEHGWSPASRYFEKPYYGDAGWSRPRDCPVDIRVAAREYMQESGGFDCSINESFTISLPATDLLAGLDVRWSGLDADFVDQNDIVKACAPAIGSAGPSALLVEKGATLNYLAREGLSLCWTVLGEKQVMGTGMTPESYKSSQLSGAYLLSSTGLTGFVRYALRDGHTRDGTPRLKCLGTHRTPA